MTEELNDIEKEAVDFSSLPVQYVKFITKRRFGIELEVSKKVTLETLVNAVKLADRNKECIASNHYQQDAGNNYWHCKFDRSCGTKNNEGGWEVASYVASGAQDLIKIAGIGPILSQAGAVVNDNCGYHIHCEIKDFEQSHAANLVAYWMKLEPIIAEILPKNRRANIYCRMLRDVKPVTDAQLKTAEAFWQRVRPLSFDNAERRVSLNMCNYALGTAVKRTAELRLPEGTLEEIDIKNWARLFIHFVNYCKRAQFPGNITPVSTLREAAIVLGLHNEEPFFILSKGLYETKQWFLNRALKYTTKKAIKTEAQEFLNFIIPPTSVVSPMLRYSYVDDEAPKKKPKKAKVTIKERPQTALLHEDDYWQPYDGQ
jgi:hypothetical protein